jgi:hypothetical protein
MERLRALADSPTFEYSLDGDLIGQGKAQSLFFANTPRIGAHIRVADGTPRDAYLEFPLGEAVLRFKHVRLRTKPRVRLFADAHRIGRTPALIEVDPAALRVLLRPAQRRSPAT